MGGAPAGRRVRARSRPVAHQKATQGRRRRATPLTVSSTRRGAAGAVFSLGTVPAAGRPLTKPCNCNAPEMAAPMRNLSASSMQLETEGPKRRARRGRQRGTPTKGLLLATTRERVMPALPTVIKPLSSPAPAARAHLRRRAPPAPGGQTGGARAARPTYLLTYLLRRPVCCCVLGFHPDRSWPERHGTHARRTPNSLQPQPWPLVQS